MIYCPNYHHYLSGDTVETNTSTQHNVACEESQISSCWTDSDLHKTLGLRQLGSASPPPQTQHCDKDEKNGWMLAKSCQNDRFV